MMSNNMVVIPVRVISHIREGIGSVARDVAEAIDHAASRGELFACRDRLGGVCALLDCLGRPVREDVAGVELDVGVHGATLATAVDVMCPVLGAAVGKLSEGDPARPEREAEYRLMVELQASVGAVLGRECAFVVPGDVVVILRGALFLELAGFAGELESVASTAAHMRDRGWVVPVARFDRARAVLDQLGWESRDPEVDVVLDMRWYGRTIREALERELDSLRDLAQEDAGAQCEWAMASAGVIERFLAGLDG
ncbi:MAG: hypothetical protein ABR992_02770 [Solirubrobacteraceae bacterium]